MSAKENLANHDVLVRDQVEGKQDRHEGLSQAPDRIHDDPDISDDHKVPDKNYKAQHADDDEASADASQPYISLSIVNIVSLLFKVPNSDCQVENLQKEFPLVLRSVRK